MIQNCPRDMLILANTRTKKLNKASENWSKTLMIQFFDSVFEENRQKNYYLFGSPLREKVTKNKKEKCLFIIYLFAYFCSFLLHIYIFKIQQNKIPPTISAFAMFFSFSCNRSCHSTTWQYKKLLHQCTANYVQYMLQFKKFCVQPAAYKAKNGYTNMWNKELSDRNDLYVDISK